MLRYLAVQLVLAALIFMPFTVLPAGSYSVSLIPYFCGALVFTGLLLVGSIWRTSWRRIAGAAGMVLTAAAVALLVLKVYESRLLLDEPHVGLNNLFQVSVLLTAMVGLFGFYQDRKAGYQGLGGYIGVLFILSALFIFWLYELGEAGPKNLVPALRSYWLPWHVLANFVGYGCFMLAAGHGVIELIQRKWQFNKLMPAAEARRYMISCIEIGFPMFTIAIILGSLWAYEAWGGYWMWDPKETWALIVWLTYAGLLHARHTRLKEGVVLPIWAIIGFFVTLFCYLGVNLFLDGLHSYGSLTS